VSIHGSAQIIVGWKFDNGENNDGRGTFLDWRADEAENERWEEYENETGPLYFSPMSHGYPVIVGKPIARWSDDEGREILLDVQDVITAQSSEPIPERPPFGNAAHWKYGVFFVAHYT
jgi:hypothetical protein